MRSPADKNKIELFMEQFGKKLKGEGRIYLTGGATALLHGWRSSTIDVDIKAAPEPPRYFETIAEIKESLDLNVELASPDQFIPELPGWESRSLFIGRHGKVDFYHYDLYSQALAKLERGHERDLMDVEAMEARQLIRKERLWELFEAIESSLIRFPALTPSKFAEIVRRYCGIER
ncbi:hypothetical protein N9V84_02945 [Verrucomicrobiales bacterium]|jgi:hypothetical protein|nr:hypothetical protein [Verrucomicrobiales bacterium]